MKKYSKKNRMLMLLLLVITISIGYAALATTLKINGTSTVKGSRWNIYWDNVQVTTGSVTGTNVTTTPTTVGTSTQTVTFSVTLPEPGDFYEFTVDAVNTGSIDAMIADEGVTQKVYSDSGYTTETTLPNVVRYTVTDASGNTIEDGRPLAKMSGNTPTRDTYKVRVEYRNDEEINPSDLDGVNDRTYYFKFEVTYVQGDGSPAPAPANPISYVTRKTPGQITPGDVIGIGETENFFVLSSNNEKTILLAQYNLLVGNQFGENSMPGYGLQSVDAIAGYCFPDEVKYGGVNFSYTNYWDNEGTLKSPYNTTGVYGGNPYPEVYDNTYVTAPDFSSTCEDDGEGNPINNCYATQGYSIAYYVEQYKNTLTTMGATIQKARLLTYEEAENTYANVKDSSNHNIVFDGTQSYWLGSAAYETDVQAVDGGGKYTILSSYKFGVYGVRPVIEIATSDIPTE